MAKRLTAFMSGCQAHKRSKTHYLNDLEKQTLTLCSVIPCGWRNVTSPLVGGEKLNLFWISSQWFFLSNKREYIRFFNRQRVLCTHDNWI